MPNASRCNPFIVNANHSASLAVEFRISDCVADCVWLAVPQPTEWQRIGDEIKAAFIFAGSDFVSHWSGGMVVSLLGRVAQTNQSSAR
jgi:hypothetical protein